jgi:nucleoside-diphosphate-sugar epimerase
MRALITGGSGYLGQLLIAGLVERGFDCIAVDIRDGAPIGPSSTLLRGDAADDAVFERAAGDGKIDVVYHLASQIDFAVDSQTALYDNNVGTTRAVAEFAKKRKIPKVVFTSSNSVYLGNKLKRPVLESDTADPADEYGRSKVDSERLLASYSSDFDSISIRCPNIMGAGRLGVLSVFFDFVLEGRKCWVIGRGDVRHQCIYAQDLIEACVKAISLRRTDVFNIGSDDVPTIREMYQSVIDKAGTGAKVASVPAAIAIPVLKAAHRLGLSPIGPYQFRMLTMDFTFDTAKIKRELGWAPTLNNSQMLLKAFEYYRAHYAEIIANSDLSANRSAITKLGLVGLVKTLS